MASSKEDLPVQISWDWVATACVGLVCHQYHVARGYICWTHPENTYCWGIRYEAVYVFWVLEQPKLGRPRLILLALCCTWTSWCMAFCKQENNSVILHSDLYNIGPFWVVVHMTTRSPIELIFTTTGWEHLLWPKSPTVSFVWCVALP